jgi:high-affinity iron transporter
MEFIFSLTRNRLGPGLALLLALAATPGCGPEGERPAAAPATAPDGGDAQRLVALVDYIGGDYPLAVKDGQVLDDGEYAEQQRFAADVRAMARGLLPGAADSDPLLSGLAAIEDLVARKADPPRVAEACKAARELAVARFQIRTMPTERPRLERAEALYAQACSECHGLRGEADTPRARTLDPAPARFKDPERLGDLSPYRVYNALTFGVPGTAMASFEDLPPADRWSLAFYVFRLGHEGEAGAGPVAMTLADLASRSDREIVAALERESHASPAAGLVHARREAAFTEPPAGVGVDRTQALLRQSAAAYASGRRTEADRMALDAYLQGFEPLEPRLRARDAGTTLRIEAAFRDLRADIASGAPPAAVGERVAALSRDVAHAAGERRVIVPFLAAFVIYLREGIEAALLVGALLATLRKLGRSDAARYVHWGWALALPAGLVTYWLFDRLVTLGADRRELVEAVVSLLAAAVLFWVSFWLISRVESRHWIAFLRAKVEAGLSRRSLLVLSGLAFLAVYREAAETVLFTQALLLEAEHAALQVAAGAGAGLLAAALAALVLNRTVLRLPLAPFFAVSSLLLCGLAVSFAGAGVYALVAAGYLTPRPVPFPEVPWMGIHPDLTGLLVQLAIVLIVVGAGVSSLRRARVAAP